MMQLRSAQLPPTRGDRIAGREVDGELDQVGPRRRCAANCRELRRLVELGCDSGVGPLGGEREMPRSFLAIADDTRECAVRGAAPPDRRVRVADGCEQRVPKAQPRVVELDDAL